MAAPEDGSASLSGVLQATLASTKDAGDDVILRVSKRLFSDDFRAYMDSFIDKHCRTFATLTDEDVSDDKVAEFTPEHYEVYQNFIRRFESKLDEYLRDEGTTAEQLLEAVAKRRDDGDKGGGAAKVFVDLLRCTTSFMSFVEWMRDEADDASSSGSGSD